MIRRLSLRFLLVLLATLPAFNTALAQLSTPPPPDINARGYLLIDFNSGQTLASKNEHESLEPASITKLMTAYAVFRALRSGQISLQDPVRISERAWRTTGSRMFIEVGTEVTVEDLLPGMIVQSGNDASVALAEHVAGSEETFAQVMNQLAQELGMTSTYYANSTGLPAPGHVTTAHDVALLGAALIREFPDYYRWYSQLEFTYNGITQGNRNLLLTRDRSVDGMKTGYTEAAGYCLVASAERDGMRLISVVLGTTSPKARADETQTLLNYGFRFFETRKIWDTGETLGTARVWKGTENATDLVVRAPVYVTAPRGGFSDISSRVELEANLVAPLDPGTPVGRVQAIMGDTALADAALYSAREVPAAGMLGSLWDELLLWFQ